MTINLFPAFSKKRNSTLRPTNGGFTVNCVLKAPTTKHRPTFELRRNCIPVGADIVDYVQWGSRYYFVTDTRYMTNDIIEIDCVLDCLATYKNDILASEQYIERSSHMYNTDIPDNLNCPTLEVIKTTTGIALPGFQFSNMDGTYILTVAGTSYVTAGVFGNGGANTYALNEGQMSSFTRQFYTKDFLEQLSMEFLNPQSAIVECKYIPIQYASITGIETEIYCGSHGVGVTGKKITYRMKYAESVIDISTMFGNQISRMGSQFERATYLWCEPYTTITLYLPFVGCVKFPTDIAYKADPRMYVMSVLDLFTGDIIYSLNTQHEAMFTAQKPIATYTGSCASDCPVSGANTNRKGTLLAALQFIGMAAGNAAMLALAPEAAIPMILASTAANFIGNTASRAVTGVVGSLEQSTQVNGTISSAISQFIATALEITTITRVPAMSSIGNANELYGRPLNEVMSLSTFSGYVKCNGAVLDIEADYETRKELEYFLDTGFYIE